MAKKRPDLKSAPGLVLVRLQLTAAERDTFRVLAAQSPHHTMAVLAQALVRGYIAASHTKSRRS